MELFSSIATVILFAFLFSNVSASRTNAMERRFIWIGFAAHILAAVAQVMISRYFYGGGDMFAYYRYGMKLVELMQLDFGTYFPRVIGLVLHARPRLPFWMFGAGSSTGAMCAVTSLVLLLNGGSLYGACMTFGFVGFAGQIALYLTFRAAFPQPVFRRRMLMACLLVPSVLFWSSSILKESIALGGLGIAVLGLAHVIRGQRRSAGMVGLVLGCALVALVKSYILMALFIAGAVWYYWQRTLNEKGTNLLISRPIYLAIGIGVASVAVFQLGRLDERLRVDTLPQETADLQQQYYSMRSAGSTYVLGGDEAGATSQRQVWLAPLGLLSALFRPQFFEIHNATSVLNAIETTWITWLFFYILYRRRWKPTATLVSRSPTMMFMLCFVLILGTGVGLAAPNLGSLSRYRIPMMPMWVGFLLLLLPVGRSAQVASR